MSTSHLGIKDDGIRRRRNPRGEPANGHVRSQSHLDAHHETHRVQPGDQVGSPSRLGPTPEGFAVVDTVHDMLDVTGR